MKRPYFIVIFVTTHLFFIFFQIHKHSRTIKLSYQNQKYEQQKEKLAQNIDERIQELYEMKKRSSIKQFAKKNLKMRKIKLSQIKRFDYNQIPKSQ